MRQVIKDCGGRAFLDKAADFASNAPKVKTLFQKFGLNPHALKDQVVKDLYESPAKPQDKMPANTQSDYRDRLARLK